MSAPPAAGVDLDTALARADRAWCKERADEPLDPDRRRHIVAGLQALLGSPAVDVDEPAVDEHQAELDRVRAFEEQRREDLRVELWKHIDAQQRRAERAEHQRNTWKGDHDRIAAQLAEAHRDARTWEGEYHRVVDDALVEVAEAIEQRDAAHAEAGRLAGLLEEAGQRIAFMERQVEDVVTRCEQLAAEASTRPTHRHAWEVQPGLKWMPLPCSCGKPWPRNGPLWVVP